MKAVIKSYHSPDIEDLEAFYPELPDDFEFLLQLLVGPNTESWGESFDVTVCTPKALLRRYNKDDVIIGRHHLIVFEYDFKRIMGKIEKFLMRCDADTWHEVALKVGELGHWEFEDYRL
ncbi:MAG: hypothetical protein DPW16_07245 [Chloroflexi bacterium]|nr:hypothetical protein [Chloroflexota bacterium]